MNNIITRSIFYILISFLILSLVIFLNNGFFTLDVFFSSAKYTLYELFGLVPFVSQFLYILTTNKISNYHIIVNTIIYWFIYLFFSFTIVDNNTIYFLGNSNNSYFIDRGYIISSKLDLLSSDFVKNVLLDIHNWDLNRIVPQSAFVLLLLNISLHIYFKRRFQMNIILRVFMFIALFLFNLYIWDSTYNVFMFVISILLLKGLGKKNEKS